MEEKKLLKRKAKASGNSNVMVSVCIDLAAYYIAHKQFSKAIQEYETLCKIYKEQKQMILYSQANRGIGEAFMGQQKFNEALKHFKIYYEVATEEKNVLEQQRALAQLGHLHLTWYLELASEGNKKHLHEAYSYFVKSMKKCESLAESIEKQDMIARLFSNLGLVKESLGDYETSHKLYEKSILICVKYDLYEQLYRGYLSMASLNEKQEKYQETVKHYNLAVEVAKKLSSNRVELICAAYLAKSETLIKIADFQGAKQVLRKAYKYKTPNKSEGKVIEKHLRVVAAMCQLEDTIIICNDDKQLKSLYEKMGDGACYLKIYDKAIEYYKKMLESAEKTGSNDKELGECYYSLAETYKDNNNFKEAERYYEMEYNLCKNNLKDCLNTICRLADVKEMASDNTEQIKLIYERGLEHCRKKGNIKEEKCLIRRYMNFLRRASCHKEAFTTEQYLKTLGEDEEEISSSSDQESEEGSAKLGIGDDIILSDITDVSDESDTDLPGTTAMHPAKRRTKPSTVKFKKNLNGEWPLHVACIKGNLKMVQYWLDVDHPVNVRDNAGWLPLHEAAVYGHLEIVRLLLDHKASINDRGGSECNGITPLHDAASNGHLEVIELLLDRGASAVAKTDDGHTPLFELQKWFARTEAEELIGGRMHLYNNLIQRMSDALDKAGQKDKDTNNKENINNITSKVGLLRKHVDNNSDEGSNSSSESPNDYQEVMQALRYKYQKKSPVKVASSKRSALINEDEFVEAHDWLEEDVRPVKNKKRRLESGELSWGRSSSFGSNNSALNPRIESPLTEEMQEGGFLDDLEHFQNRRSSSNASFEDNRSSKRRQVTLLDSGFSKKRNSNSPKDTNWKRSSSEHGLNISQPKITNYGSPIVVEADSSTRTPSKKLLEPNQSNITQSDPMLFVDVEIEGKIFRVPILMSQLQTNTIKWLAQEAALRYESKQFIKPVLELETTNGAILDDNDSLGLLFPMGHSSAEKIVGKVVEWSLTSLLERYKETCHNMGVDANEELSGLIQSLSISLDLRNRGFLSEELSPLFKSLHNQKSLTEINLQGNFVNTQTMSLLCSSLATLPNLETLNLCCTSIQDIGQLASSISAVPKLKTLNLSDNILLKHSCLKDLNVITNSVSLRTLNLSNIGLGDLSNCPEALCLKTLDSLDVSLNELNDNDLRKFFTWTDGNVLKTLNVSRNRGQRPLKQLLNAFNNESIIVLQEINLCASKVNDTDLFDLLRMAENLSKINLSHNNELTSISLRRLLGQGRLSEVNLTFCNNIWTYFDANEIGWNIGCNRAKGIVLKISQKFHDCIEGLLRIFKEKYENCLNATFNERTVVVEVTFQ
ncbi:hypothetical protein ABEB36_001030 [Hypothenemus hampei]|uniref:Tonsoku-like protein n=1 Tax=Hypothenemus hampei TaxID=57062 RepID=A0ABD1FGJ2_HYPHA